MWMRPRRVIILTFHSVCSAVIHEAADGMLTTPMAFLPARTAK